VINHLGALLSTDYEIKRASLFRGVEHHEYNDPATLKTILARHGFSTDLPIVFFDGRRRYQQGVVSKEHLLRAQKLFSNYSGTYALVPPYQSPYVIFSIFGTPIAIASASEIQSAESTKLHQLAMLYNIETALTAVSDSQSTEPDQLLSAYIDTLINQEGEQKCAAA
jgi:hypothetical protein